MGKKKVEYRQVGLRAIQLGLRPVKKTKKQLHLCQINHSPGTSQMSK